jgi:hypothetical protein
MTTYVRVCNLDERRPSHWEGWLFVDDRAWYYYHLARRNLSFSDQIGGDILVLVVSYQ